MCLRRCLLPDRGERSFERARVLKQKRLFKCAHKSARALILKASQATARLDGFAKVPVLRGMLLYLLRRRAPAYVFRRTRVPGVIGEMLGSSDFEGFKNGVVIEKQKDVEALRKPLRKLL